jgi:hypothetical protein
MYLFSSQRNKKNHANTIVSPEFHDPIAIGLKTIDNLVIKAIFVLYHPADLFWVFNLLHAATT